MLCEEGTELNRVKLLLILTCGAQGQKNAILFKKLYCYPAHQLDSSIIGTVFFSPLHN